jgi:hypothetical protein
MSSSIEPMRAASAPSTARRRIDIKALMSMHLRPYAIVKNWREEFEILKEYRARFAKDVNGAVMALSDDHDWDSKAETLVLALDLRDALPSREAINQAEMTILAALQAPFSEPHARLLTGVMLDGMPAKPGEAAAVSVDAMVYSLEELRLEHEGDIVVPTAAIAATVKDVWKERTFRPSIHEMLGYVRRHWIKLVEDVRSVGVLSNFVATLDELVPAETETVPARDGQNEDGDDVPF